MASAEEAEIWLIIAQEENRDLTKYSFLKVKIRKGGHGHVHWGGGRSHLPLMIDTLIYCMSKKSWRATYCRNYSTNSNKSLVRSRPVFFSLRFKKIYIFFYHPRASNIIFCNMLIQARPWSKAVKKPFFFFIVFFPFFHLTP